MIELTSSPSLDDNPLCTDWFDFSTDGRVLLRTGKVEIGQGILTALVQIAADELDIDPARFDVLCGHTRLGPLEGQTSSSLSIEVTGRAIRLAASATRQVMVNEAARLLQAQPAEVSVDDGAIFVGGRDTPLSYWTMAGTVDLDAAVLAHASPKATGDRRLIGTSMPRIDLRDKAATAAFIQDVAVDGMLHGRAMQPPAPGRRLRSFDEAALAARYPNIRIVRNGSFVGVIAEREEIAVNAIAAARELAVWDDGAAAPDDLMAAIAGSKDPEQVVVEEGRMAGPPGHSVELTIRKSFTAHGSIAPSCAIAAWRDGHLEVHSHSQGPHGLRDALAIVFDLNATADVTVIYCPSAGTYGHSGQDDVALDAALLARAVPGTAVRVLWSRADDFFAAPVGPGMVVRAAATLADDGRISHFSIVSNSQPHAQRPGRGGFAGMTAASLIDPPLPESVADDVPAARGGGAERNATPLYVIPNLRVAKRILKDLPVRTSALRGLGAFANVCAVEATMDEAALLAGRDPVAFRLDHLEDERARDVISRAAAMAGWPGSVGDGRALGVGFAQYKNKSAYCAVVVEVELDETVRVTRAWAAADAGEVINPDGLANQIEGGIVQATSWTLKEALEFHGDSIVSDSWDNYPILKFSEVPDITVELIDRPELAPLGAGETSIGPTAAAISNAVRRALGVRIAQLPITREAILAASA